MIVYYISIIINILCILTYLIISYLEYKKNKKILTNDLILFVFLISGLIFMIMRNFI